MSSRALRHLLTPFQLSLANPETTEVVVNRPGDHLHIVDQAIVPEQRNRGLGTAIMRQLMTEAAASGQPVRLKVASTNDPSMRLYARLGFVPIHDDPLYIEMEWRAADGR